MSTPARPQVHNPVVRPDNSLANNPSNNAVSVSQSSLVPHVLDPPMWSSLTHTPTAMLLSPNHIPDATATPDVVNFMPSGLSFLPDASNSQQHSDTVHEDESVQHDSNTMFSRRHIDPQLPEMFGASQVSSQNYYGEEHPYFHSRRDLLTHVMGTSTYLTSPATHEPSHELQVDAPSVYHPPPIPELNPPSTPLPSDITFGAQDPRGAVLSNPDVFEAPVEPTGTMYTATALTSLSVSQPTISSLAVFNHIQPDARSNTMALTCYSPNTLSLDGNYVFPGSSMRPTELSSFTQMPESPNSIHLLHNFLHE